MCSQMVRPFKWRKFARKRYITFLDWSVKKIRTRDSQSHRSIIIDWRFYNNAHDMKVKFQRFKRKEKKNRIRNSHVHVNELDLKFQSIRLNGNRYQKWQHAGPKPIDTWYTEFVWRTWFTCLHVAENFKQICKQHHLCHNFWWNLFSRSSNGQFALRVIKMVVHGTRQKNEANANEQQDAIPFVRQCE